MKDLYTYLTTLSISSDFTADLSKRGGYITFSNSGRPGGIKYFQIGLESLIQTLNDILKHIDIFSKITEYIFSEGILLNTHLIYLPLSPMTETG